MRPDATARAGGSRAPGEQLFSRFTPRARNVLAAGGRLAGDQAAGAAHLAAALLTEPEGLGARIIQRAGLTGEQVCTAVGAGPAAAAGDAGAEVLRELSFTEDGEAALRGTLKAALRLGHNYIGTEHVLRESCSPAAPRARPWPRPASTPRRRSGSWPPSSPSCGPG